MDSRKIRQYPPIIVGTVATLMLTAAAFTSIRNSVSIETAASGYTQEQPQVTTMATTDADPCTTTTTAESTYKSKIPSRDWDAEESQMLMKIAMAEAEGESVEGKALVMLVVLNRVWDDDFPGTIEEVIFEPGQFSPVKEGGRYYTTEPNSECYEALELVMQGWDESQGALYFESCEGDSWHSQNLEFLFQEGKHKFYR